jgi:hypothetical protein
MLFLKLIGLSLLVTLVVCGGIYCGIVLGKAITKGILD